MKPLSRRALVVLGTLQAAVRELTNDRNAALRVLRASRSAAILSAQQEYWLEFQWLDQEYRYAVRKLADFCARHAPLAAIDESKQV
jgi:hypothetical protein